MARYMRGYGQYKLGDPIVGPGIAWHGPGTYLVTPYSPNAQNRRKARYALRPPQVVNAPQIFFGPKVVLNVMTPERLRQTVTRRRPQYALGPPVILATNGSIKTTFTRIRRVTAKSFLRPPTDTVGLEDQGRVLIRLAPSHKGKYQSRLFPPAVVGAGIAWHGPGVYLTLSYRRPGRARLAPPAVVTPLVTETFYGPATSLAPSRRVLPVYHLYPPAILDEERFGLTQTWLTYSRRGRPLSILRKPTDTIGLEDQGLGPTWLTYSRRGRAQYDLKPPTDTVGPEDQGQVSTWLTYSRRGRPVYDLHPPTDTVGIEDQGQVSTTLAPSRRGQPKSDLKPPSVVAVAEFFYGTQIWLTYSRRGKPLNGLGRTPAAQVNALGGVMVSLAPQRRGQAKSKLPQVLVAAAAQVYYGPAVHLTRIRPRRVLSVLRKPTDTIGLEDQGQVSTTLAYSRRGRPVYRLQPPAILQTNGEIRVTLAPQRRGVPKSDLRAPVVVFLAVEIYGPVVVLTRIKPPPTVAVLRPPTDISDQQDIGFLHVHLTYSRRGRPVYALRPFSARAFEVSYGPAVTLTPSRRPVTRSVLRPPTVVAPVVSYGPLQWLTYSRRGTPKPFLKPPAVISQPPAFLPPEIVQFAPQRRPVAKSDLKPPSVVGAGIVFFGPGVYLTRSSRPRTQWKLRPPVLAVAAVIYYGPKVTLTRIRRVDTLAQLHGPTAVIANPVAPLTVHLTYSRRGRPESFLKAPTRVFPVLFFGPQVTLRPQVRGKAKPFLRPPVVVRLAVEIYGPKVTLAPIKPRPTVTLLRPPAVVGREGFRPIQVDLARIKPRATIAFRQAAVIREPFFARAIQVHVTRIKPRKTTTFLKQPTVVRHEAFFGFISLAPSFRGRPKSLLKPPTVVRAAFVARGIQVHLTRITPAPTLALVKPPSVVGAGIAFYGPLTALVRIRPPKVIHFLRLTLVAFRRPHGDVCGFDIAGSFVCSLETPGSQVSGSSSSRFGISGSSRAATRIAGSESPGGSVSGSDRKAT